MELRAALLSSIAQNGVCFPTTRSETRPKSTGCLCLTFHLVLFTTICRTQLFVGRLASLTVLSQLEPTAKLFVKIMVYLKKLGTQLSRIQFRLCESRKGHWIIHWSNSRWNMVSAASKRLTKSCKMESHVAFPFYGILDSVLLFFLSKNVLWILMTSCHFFSRLETSPSTLVLSGLFGRPTLYLIDHMVLLSLQRQLSWHHSHHLARKTGSSCCSTFEWSPLDWRVSHKKNSFAKHDKVIICILCHSIVYTGCLRGNYFLWREQGGNKTKGGTKSHQLKTTADNSITIYLYIFCLQCFSTPWIWNGIGFHFCQVWQYLCCQTPIFIDFTSLQVCL